MDNKVSFIEELYIAFQLAVALILLNTSFPLFGTNDDVYSKILSLGYLGFVIFRIIKSVTLATSKGNIFKNNSILLTGLIEGVFLFAFIIVNTYRVISLSSLVLTYVIVQTIRVPSKERYYFCLLAIIIESYSFFVSGMNLQNLMKLCFDSLIILFISFCIAVVLREFHKLQSDNEKHVYELESLNNKLIKLANMDYLTGIYNHKAFYITLNNFKDYRYGQHSSLCMALIDIDNFKQVNDTYGHLAGDKILNNLAVILKQNIRSMDFLARYGGEEFGIMFPDVSLKEGEAICERLRKAVEKHTFEVDGQGIRITISIGLNCLEDFQYDQVKNFVKSVDELLYIAKRSGKNRIATVKSDCNV